MRQGTQNTALTTTDAAASVQSTIVTLERTGPAKNAHGVVFMTAAVAAPKSGAHRQSRDAIEHGYRTSMITGVYCTRVAKTNVPQSPEPGPRSA